MKILRTAASALVGVIVAATVAFAAASYPTSVKSFSARSSGQVIAASWFNDLQDEVSAIETGLLSGLSHEVLVTLGTITTDKSLLDGTATWNAGGVTFNAIKANITDTASASASRLLSLQIAGADRAYIDKAGSEYLSGSLGVGDIPDDNVGRVAIRPGTLTADKPLLGGTATWNAGGVVFTAVEFNITDTASAAASLLMDLQVDGVSKFKVDKTGIADFSAAVRIGTNPAAGAHLRLAHAVSLVSVRNVANSGDISVLQKPTADELRLGDGGQHLRLSSDLGTPLSLANGDWWVECSGTSPSRVCAIKVFDGGATRTIASVTY